MRYYDKETISRFVYVGNRKCKDSIRSCKTHDQLDVTIDMCNMFGRVVCSLLNNEDYKYAGVKFNIHKKWCKEVYSILNKSLSELDNAIGTQRAEIDRLQTIAQTVGFN